MEEKANQLSERLLDYGVKIVKLTMKLHKTDPGRHIAGQLLRCGTSVGANYEEACGAQSRADFIHKLQIVMKEIRESMYWIKLIKRSEISESKELDKLIDETKQISSIVAKSLITAKRGNK
ncbi:MAG: four helix bundle protein [bacterium]